ncbi:MAG: F0F1 ATP synthase subunit gamma [Polyangiaceae bacterium]|jgi:F-type H+-transporting ATPase subunit gamma
MSGQRLTDLQNRIRGLGELQDVVGAMRSLSAVRVQQAHETLLAIRQYAGLVEAALAETAARVPVASGRVKDGSGQQRGRPPPHGTTVVVAFGSEHGFVGAFNDRVLDRAFAEIGSDADRLFLIGSRVAMVAAERRRSVAWTSPMASPVAGVHEVALRTADEIGRSGVEDLRRLVLVYTRSTDGAVARLVAESLMPGEAIPDSPRRAEKPRPLSNLAPGELLDKLVDELVFAKLTHAAMESFASESAARLAAMTSAHDNIEDKLAVMIRLEREGRQEQITTELLDVVTGAEASLAGGS